MCRTASFGVYSNLPRIERSSSLGSSSSASASSACVATTARSKRRTTSSSVRTSTPSLVAAQAANREVRVGESEVSTHGLHVGVRATRDRSPAMTPKPEHPVIVEEADRVRGRDVERPARCGRPEGRSQRDDEVTAEAPRVAPFGQVVAERGVLVGAGLDRRARRAEPAPDLPDEGRELRARRVAPLRERLATRVLEPARVAADRERHLRRLEGDAELRAEPREQRVVALVGDDEARVESEAVVHDGVDVPAQPRVALEHVHLVAAARQHVRCAKPGDAATDHRDSHRRHSYNHGTNWSKIGTAT